MDYTVINDNTPFFRWVNSTQKARQGNVKAGFIIHNGEPFHGWLIIRQSMPGAEQGPPYVMSLSAVREIGAPPVDSEGPAEITIEAHDVTVVGLGKYRYQDAVLKKVS